MSEVAAAALRQKIRIIVATGGVASITAVGAWYGASLKTDQQIKQKVKKQQEATPAEKIAVLEAHRGTLIAKKIGLEKKLKQVQMQAAGVPREEAMQGRERRR